VLVDIDDTCHEGIHKSNLLIVVWVHQENISRILGRFHSDIFLGSHEQARREGPELVLVHASNTFPYLLSVPERGHILDGSLLLLIPRLLGSTEHTGQHFSLHINLFE